MTIQQEITGAIALAAKSELPSSWAALRDSSEFGPNALQKRITSVKMSLFNEDISSAIEEALDQRVIDYAGKLVALSLINPARDYWSKQPLSVGASGRNETKAWNDRSARLDELRKDLLADTRAMLPEVQELLPNRRGPRADIVTVQDGTGLTPNPFDFEAPFGTS